VFLYKTNILIHFGLTDNSVLLQNVKTFEDVKGCDDAKKELEEVVEYLKNPSKFTRLGGKLPKVITLYPPESSIC
jgi:cell division protease FtsH